jgi:hypothetical protein
MNSLALRRLALALLLSVPVLWLIGPGWPGGYDRLLCDSWSPFYYFVLIPAILIHGVLFLWPRVIIGTVAVLAVVMIAITVMPLVVLVLYSAGMRIPLLMQAMAIGWPQLVLFPAVLQTASGKVLPYELAEWGFAVSIFAWAALGIPFGAAVHRLRSPWLIVALAFAFVAGVTIALLKAAPLLGWKYLLGYP